MKKSAVLFLSLLVIFPLLACGALTCPHKTPHNQVFSQPHCGEHSSSSLPDSAPEPVHIMLVIDCMEIDFQQSFSTSQSQEPTYNPGLTDDLEYFVWQTISSYFSTRYPIRGSPPPSGSTTNPLAIYLVTKRLRI